MLAVRIQSDHGLKALPEQNLERKSQGRPLAPIHFLAHNLSSGVLSLNAGLVDGSIIDNQHLGNLRQRASNNVTNRRGRIERRNNGGN